MGLLARFSAPAKLNLHLRVLGRRRDGYHDLVSLFQAISIYDEIAVEMAGPADAIEIEGSFDVPPEKNTMALAAASFRGETGIREGIRIRAVKRIPAGAGLGGGSSDAAAVLVSLNALCGTDLKPEILFALGAGVGSDVPFFLGEPCALVSGRGERLEPLNARDDFACVVVYPGYPVSTRLAYESWDAGTAEEAEKASMPRHETLDEMRKILAMYRRDPASWDFENSFSTVLRGRYPAIERMIGDLKECGASFACLSGSGSACFGVFPSMGKAEKASEFLRSRWERVIPAIPLARKAMVVVE